MDSVTKLNQLPSPPPYFTPDEGQSERGVRSYQVQIPPPPAFTLSPGPLSPVGGTAPSPLVTVIFNEATSPTVSQARFVSYEGKLQRDPGLTACPSCQIQVNTQITYCTGTHAWLMCFLFILCGMWLGCCLIPFFVDHFKDVYHTCPRCQRVLHIHRTTCCS